MCKAQWGDIGAVIAPHCPRGWRNSRTLENGLPAGVVAKLVGPFPYCFGKVLVSFETSGLRGRKGSIGSEALQLLFLVVLLEQNAMLLQSCIIQVCYYSKYLKFDRYHELFMVGTIFAVTGGFHARWRHWIINISKIFHILVTYYWNEFLRHFLPESDGVLSFLVSCILFIWIKLWALINSPFKFNQHRWNRTYIFKLHKIMHLSDALQLFFIFWVSV